jgi:hypothetical protein
MERKGIQRKIERTAEDKARLKAVREQFQRDQPTLEQLVKSGDYSGPFKQAKRSR